MHGTKGPEDDQQKLNNEADLHINRGFELMLRKNTKKEEPKTFHIRFGKMVAILKREFHLHFELSLDIKKTS